MGEVINLNRYRRERKRELRQSAPAVFPAKIEPNAHDPHEEQVRQLEDQSKSSTVGVLSLPQPRDGPKDGGPETV